MEDLIKALNIIKDTCKRQEKCKTCPFSLNEDCLIINSDPSGWNIQETPVQKILLESE